MQNAKNVINITKCDNQLTIVAVSSNRQTVYQLVQAGSGSAVDINVTLEEGDYVLPQPILNKSENTVVKLPADTYEIYYTGLNLGGPYNFEFTLNEVPYELLEGQGAAKYGYVWNHGGPDQSTILVTIG